MAEVKQKFIAEKDEMFKEVKQQAASLVIQATAKVLGKVAAPKLDKELIEQAVKEVVNKSKSKNI